MDAVKTGCLIAERRKQLNMTQKELAQKLHVSAQAVSKWERGLSFPDVSLLEPLAQQLDLTVSEVLSGSWDVTPQEELIRDSLRLSISQLGTKAQTWRKFFLLAAVLLLVLSAWLGHSYVKNHTKLLPQRETIISYRESTPSEQLAANVAGGVGNDIAFYDITYADDITGAQLQLELWTDEGLMKTWQLARAFLGGLEGLEWHRQETIALSLDVQFNPELFLYGATMYGGYWLNTLEDVPYLSAGYGMNFLEETTVVSRDYGAVLACYYLDTTGQGLWYAAPCLGAVEKPTVEQDQAMLLLRLFYEYE
mgnify:FL=1